jgi:hypothetical protein
MPPSLVDDHCEPVIVDHFSDDDLECFSLRDLYARSSARLQVEPVDAITIQLASAPGDHHQVMAINTNQCYLGWRRCAALVPVIAACPRLTHLHLQKVGLDAATAKALVRVLSTHPGIQVLDVSMNDLGANVGEKVLRLVTEHRRIHTINVDHCLFVTPVLRKIKLRVQDNFSIRDNFSVPLIPERLTAADIAAAKMREEQEQLRRDRQEAEKQRLAELIPGWAPAAMLELHETLHKHRHHLADIVSVFRPTTPGSRTTDAKSFVRAMKILDVRSLATAQTDEAKAHELADLFCAWDKSQNTINFGAIVAALRTHATVVGGPNVTVGKALPPSLVPLADTLYDSRLALLRSFEMIDVDMAGTVSSAEAVVGITALTAAPAEQVEALLRFALVSEGDGATAALAELPARVHYRGLMDSIGIAETDDAAPPMSDFDLKRSQVRALGIVP